VAIRELVAAVVGCIDTKPRVVWDTARPSGEPVRLMDVTRAREVLGFTARTPLSRGVAETVAWYRANRGVAARRYNVFHQADYMA
jgi:GDP-L-fucose synthase